MNAAERLRTSKDKEKVIAVGDFIVVTDPFSIVVWMEAKFQKIREVKKESVSKEGSLQKLVEKEKSMIDKAIKSNNGKSLFGIGYYELVDKGRR